EKDLGDQAETGERRETAKIDRDHRRLSRLEPAKQHSKADAEEKGERPPGLLLDQHPHGPADQVLRSLDLDSHLLVEVHQDHSEQCEATEDVERVNALVGIEWCECHGGWYEGSGSARHEFLAAGCSARISRLSHYIRTDSRRLLAPAMRIPL